MEIEKQKGRIEYIDFVRGFAMLLCIVGHAGVTGWLRGYIYSYHMPLFFIISGMVYKHREKISDFVKNKARDLLIPYYFWSFVWLIFWALLYFFAYKLGVDNEKSFSVTDSILGIILDTRGKRFGGYIWFLYALFGTVIVYDLLQRIKNKKITGGIVIILMLVEVIYLQLGAPAVPFCLDVIPFTLIFMYVGKIIGSSYRNLIIRRFGRLWTIIICIVIHIAAFCANYMLYGSIDMYTRQYGNIILYFLESIFGSIACIMLCEIVCDYSFQLIRIIKKFFVWLGKNSLIYYVLHTMVYVVLRNISKVLLIKLGNHVIADIFVMPVFNVIIAFPLIYMVNLIVYRYTPILIGKNKRNLNLRRNR